MNMCWRGYMRAIEREKLRTKPLGIFNMRCIEIIVNIKTREDRKNIIMTKRIPERSVFDRIDPDKPFAATRSEFCKGCGGYWICRCQQIKEGKFDPNETSPLERCNVLVAVV